MVPSDAEVSVAMIFDGKGGLHLVGLSDMSGKGLHFTFTTTHTNHFICLEGLLAGKSRCCWLFCWSWFCG
jgi:hypothetical protein